MSSSGKRTKSLPSAADLAEALRAAAGELGLRERQNIYRILSGAPATVVSGMANQAVFNEIKKDAVSGVDQAAAAIVAITAADNRFIDYLLDFVRTNTSTTDFADHLAQNVAVQTVIAHVLASDVKFSGNQIDDFWSSAAAPLGMGASRSQKAPDDALILGALGNINSLLGRHPNVAIGGSLTRGLTRYALFRSSVVVEKASQTLDRIFERENSRVLQAQAEAQEIRDRPEWIEAVSEGDNARRQINMINLMERLYSHRSELSYQCVNTAADAFQYDWSPGVREHALGFMQRVVIAEGKLERKQRGKANTPLIGYIATYAVMNTDDPASAALRQEISNTFPSFRKTVDPGHALRATTALILKHMGQSG